MNKFILMLKKLREEVIIVSTQTDFDNSDNSEVSPNHNPFAHHEYFSNTT